MGNGLGGKIWLEKPKQSPILIQLWAFKALLFLAFAFTEKKDSLLFDLNKSGKDLKDIYNNIWDFKIFDNNRPTVIF